MAKKSILYIITKSVWGGATRYVYDLAVNLNNEFEVSVAAGGQDKFAQRIQQANLPYYQIKNFQRSVNPFKDFFAFFEILKLLFRLKPDIVHVNSSKAGGLVGLAAWCYRFISRRKIRLVFTAHGWAFNEDRSGWQIWLIKLLSKLTVLFYDKIICVSEYDRQIAIKNRIAPVNKLVAIHNGIDIESISFLPKEEAQKKLLGKTSPLVIGTIAEWTKNKGLVYLLEAVKEVQRNQKRVALLDQSLKATVQKGDPLNISIKVRPLDVVLIGSGENPDKEKIERFIEKHELKNVHLIEWLDNAANYLKAFDIFVLPSVKEGLPYAILEAMAAQVPIVATNVGGVSEMLSRAPKRVAPSDQSSRTIVRKGDPLNVGLLIPPKNSQELAAKINYLIENPEIAQAMAQKASQKVIREFSLEKMLQKTKRAYF